MQTQVNIHYIEYIGFFALAVRLLFSVKQCVPTAAVSLGTFAYELVYEFAVSHLCTVRLEYMVYLA